MNSVELNQSETCTWVVYQNFSFNFLVCNFVKLLNTIIELARNKFNTYNIIKPDLKHTLTLYDTVFYVLMTRVVNLSTDYIYLFTDFIHLKSHR